MDTSEIFDDDRWGDWTSAFSAAGALERRPEIASVVWASTESPEGYGSCEVRAVFTMKAGGFGALNAWCDTTGRAGLPKGSRASSPPCSPASRRRARVADERPPFLCPWCGGPMVWLLPEVGVPTCDTLPCPNNWHGREVEAREAINHDGTWTLARSKENQWLAPMPASFFPAGHRRKPDA